MGQFASGPWAGSPAAPRRGRAGRCGRARRAGMSTAAVRDPLQPDPSLGQGAGLVEAQHVDPAERLDRARVADQDVAARQPPGGRELADRGDQRQPLGHGRDGQADAGAECVAQRSAPQQAGADERRARAQGDRNGGLVSRRSRSPTPSGLAGRRLASAARAAELGLGCRWRRPRRWRGPRRPRCPRRACCAGRRRWPRPPARPALATSCDSPVRLDSSTSRSSASRMRQSPATASPGP